MAFTIVQAGTALQLVDTAGVIATITLPTNITLSALRTPRFALFSKYVVMVNSPTRPISIDGEGIARVLTPRPPISIPVLTGVAGGTLSGSFRVKQTFRIKDANGNVIAESDFGPASAAVSISSQWLRVTGLDISPDAVTSTMLYRTTSTGSVYFPWIELDGNTQTSLQDDLADAGLSLAAAPAFGSVPDLTLITEWKGRLWGADRLLIDDIRYCESGRMFSWPAANTVPIPKLGADHRGVTAVMARKDALGVGRMNSIYQMSANSDNSLFKPVKVTESCGVESQESVAVFLDTAYFLWKDGVYQWSNEGVTCISDGKVRSWFATGDYFNQSKFAQSFAYVDPNTKRYKLFLCSAGSSTIDRWVEYDLIEKKWWGPHKTGAFTPSCVLVAKTAEDVQIPMIGSAAGYLFKERSARTDSTATAIDFDVDTKRQDAKTPQVVKIWGETRIASVPLSTGRMVVTASVGELDAAAATRTLQYDMTLGAGTIGRLGVGKHAKLNFRENTPGQDVQLTGYECDFFEAGIRS